MVINLLADNWLVNALEWVCMFIDAIVYQVLAAFYNIFLAVVNLDFNLFDNLFDNVLSRLYLVLSVFMLFKISFELLKMLAEPGKAESEGTVLVKNIFISIVMLIAAPLVFDILHQFQEAIIKNNTIQTIILGSNASNLNEKSAGPAFSWALLQAFVHPVDSNGNELDGGWESSTINGKPRQAYDKIWNGENYSLTQLTSVVSDTRIGYTPIISTIVGIAVIAFLIKFTIDVGIRAFKLLFYQSIAPIPIISYMSSSKGKNTFNTFKDNYISTYLDLFIRLAVVYLVLMLANKILADKGSLGLSLGTPITGLPEILAKVLLIIALFKFAVDIPGIINSALGTKFSNNYGDKLTKNVTRLGMGAAGLVGGAVGGGLGSLAGSALRGDFLNEEGKVTVGGIGKVLGNAGGGALRGARAAGKAGYDTTDISSLKNARAAITGLGKATVSGIDKQKKHSAEVAAAGGILGYAAGRANTTLGKIDNAFGGAARAEKYRQIRQNKADNYATQVRSGAGYTGAQSNLTAAHQDTIASQQSVDVAQAGFDSAQANYDAVQSNVVSAQNAYDSSSEYVSDLDAVKSAIARSYADGYGVDYETTYKYMQDNPGEIDDYLNGDGVNDVNVANAIRDFNDKHSDNQIVAAADGYHFELVEQGANTEMSIAGKELAGKQAELSAADIAVQNAQSTLQAEQTRHEGVVQAETQAQEALNAYEADIQAYTDRQVNDYGYDRNTPEGRKKIRITERRLGNQNTALEEDKKKNTKSSDQILLDALKNYNSGSNK